MIFILPATVAAQEATTPQTDITGVGVSRYTRKSVTYFPMEDSSDIPSGWYGNAVKAARKAVEIGRFDVNELPVSSGSSVPEFAKLVRQYVDTVKAARAREQAEYDFRFKDQVITAELLRRIADSAFIYQPYIDGWSTRHVDASILSPLPGFEARIRGGAQFWRVDFSTGDLENLGVVKVDVTGFANDQTRQRGSALLAAQEDALEEFSRELSAKVRNLEAFQLSINVTRADLNSVYFDLVRSDGVEIDTYFRVMQTYSDGSRRQIGWIKSRQVGDGVKSSQTRAEVVALSGAALKLEGGEELVELAQVGSQWVVRGGWSLIRVRDHFFMGDATGTSGGNDSGGVFVSVERQWSLAKTTGISELYAAPRIGIALPLPYLEGNAEGVIFKRFYFRRLILGTGVAAGVYAVLIPSDNPDVRSARGFGVGVRPEADVELWLTPSWHIHAYAAYRLYTPNLGVTDQDGDPIVDNSGESIGYDQFKYSPSGLMFGAGVNYAF